RGLDLERRRVGGLPVQRDPADARRRAEVDFQPLRVGEGARPAGAGVAVGGAGRRGARVLGGGGGGGLVQRQVGGAAGCRGRLGGGRAQPGDQDGYDQR